MIFRGKITQDSGGPPVLRRVWQLLCDDFQLRVVRHEQMSGPRLDTTRTCCSSAPCCEPGHAQSLFR
jgi:hypothetical protein